MNGRDDGGALRRLDRLPPMLGHAERAPKQRLSRGRTQTDDHARPDGGDLGEQPGIARAHLGGVGLLVNAPLATRGRGAPLEVLDRIGDEGLRALDSRLFECPGQQASRGTDERVPGAILLVAWLLADQEAAARARDLRRRRSEWRCARADRRGRSPPPRAAPATGCPSVECSRPIRWSPWSRLPNAT